MTSNHVTHQSSAGIVEKHASRQHYQKLTLMAALSFIAMYALMYAMVDRLDNVFSSVNQIYMAGLMTAAMIIIELAIMGSMYPRKGLNVILVIASTVALLVFWGTIRQQTAIGDRQFLRSMIPHHAGAVLMCEEASIRDPEIVRLCASIIESQTDEIRQMKAMLARTDN